MAIIPASELLPGFGRFHADASGYSYEDGGGPLQKCAGASNFDREF